MCLDSSTLASHHPKLTTGDTTAMEKIMAAKRMDDMYVNKMLLDFVTWSVVGVS